MPRNNVPQRQDAQNPPESAVVVRFERSLATLGFFTPSSKKTRRLTEKTVTLNTTVAGRRVEARATIVGSAKFGLPTTSDQDTYLAILKLAGDRRRNGRVENPVSFSSAELLRLQGKTPAGTNYDELQRQLLRMVTVTIMSEDAVYLASKKVWAKDAFHVFDRVVLLGGELDGGLIADQNHVWLSAWQLENLNAGHYFPIDYDTYRELRNHIAKALAPPLHVWLFASRADGVFRKRYKELCQFLDIVEYEHVSKIREKLAPALNELARHGYLADWRIERTVDGQHYNLVLEHGPRYRQAKLIAAPEVDPKEGDESGDMMSARLEGLRSRGVHPAMAKRLLSRLVEDQDVEGQLEWGDFLVSVAKKGKYWNPPGFYVSLLQRNVNPPEFFETSARRRLRIESTEKERARFQRDQELRRAYEKYCLEYADRYLDSLSRDDYAALLEPKIGFLRREYAKLRWTEESLADGARQLVINELIPTLPLLSFTEFGATCTGYASGDAATTS